MLKRLKINRNKEQLNAFFLDGIRKNDSAVIEQIFDQFRPGIQRFIKEHGGVREDADDIFMDALEVILRKMKNNSLKLDCAFYTYLFAVCKYMWWNKTRRKKFQSGVTIDSWEVLTMGEEPKIEMEKMERSKLYQEKFKLLKEDCRKILDLHLIQKKSLAEIAKIMGHKSANYTGKRKHICKKRLKEMIKADQRFEELKYE